MGKDRRKDIRRKEITPESGVVAGNRQRIAPGVPRESRVGEKTLLAVALPLENGSHNLPS
jgi:hypothetical protein